MTGTVPPYILDATIRGVWERNQPHDRPAISVIIDQNGAASIALGGSVRGGWNVSRARAQSTSRFGGVQALRYLAALLVVVTHSTLYAQERLQDSQHIWRLGGTLGVEIFFGISGFVMVISTRSLAGRPDAWKYFTMRRLVRIVPLYWMATTLKVIALLLAAGVILHSVLDGKEVALSYFFLPSRNVDGAVEPLLGVGWTLMYEMFFYLIFAIGLRLRVDLVLFCGTVLSLCALGTIPRGDDWPPALVYLNPIVMYFFVGMLLGRWVGDRNLRRLAFGLLCAVAVWVVTAVGAPPAGEVFDWSELVRHVAVTALLVLTVTAEQWLAGRIPRGLVWLGDASYSLYLIHPLIAPAVPLVLAKAGVISVPLSIALTLVSMTILAALIFRYVESNVTHWLQRRLPYIRVHPVGVVERRP